jgi:hypothetical protein
MTIPEIRRRLHELAVSAGIPELAELAEATRRRPAPRVAPVKSRPLEPWLAEWIRETAEENPDATQMEIAREFGVNIGRVSEALHGKRQ